MLRGNLLKVEDVGSITRTINISEDPNKPNFVHFVETWNRESRKYFINGEVVSPEEYMCSAMGIPAEMLKQRDGSQKKVEIKNKG